MHRASNQQGQSILEYALVVAVVVIAMILMQGITKKALSGRHLQSAKQISEEFFEPTAGAEFRTGTEYHSARVDHVYGTDQGEHKAGDSFSQITGGESNVRTEFAQTNANSTQVTGIGADTATNYLKDEEFKDLETVKGTPWTQPEPSTP